MSLDIYGFRRYTVCTNVGWAEYENRTECLTCHYGVSIEGYAPYCTTRRHSKKCLLAARFDVLIEALREESWP